MQAMKCELCGSNDIVKQGGVYVCQHCGTKYSVEEARKLIGVVQIDKSKDTENYLMLARRAKSENNVTNAGKYYDMVLQNEPTNWEACFYQVYFQAMNCRIIEMESAINSIANNIPQTISLIQNYVDITQQKEALDEVIDNSARITMFFANASKDYCEKKNTGDNAYADWYPILKTCLNIYDALDASITNQFGNTRDKIIKVKKLYIEYLDKYGFIFSMEETKQRIKKLESEISALDPAYNPPKQKKGCYVATCVYGSYDCPPVWTLRRFRDYSLVKTWYGRAFIRLYYAISPTLVKWFGEKEWIKRIWRYRLNKMVDYLQNNGYDSTPYID